MILIDDSPVERARIREGLPEVLVPDWPEESMQFRGALLAIPELDTVAVSREDATRSRMYAAERMRRETRSRLPSLEEWIESLELRVEATPLGPSNLQRATQLLNKTNQMNLSTRRLTESELAAWSDGEGRSVWAFVVADKFADYGLTGVLSLEVGNGSAQIVDYVLSCRVMGRKIEETLLHAAIEEASGRGAKEVTARFLPTKKNMPCLAFLRGCGMEADDSSLTFRWDTAREFPLPRAVRLTRHPREGRPR
jgi:FkbH-like protein